MDSEEQKNNMTAETTVEPAEPGSPAQKKGKKAAVKAAETTVEPAEPGSPAQKKRRYFLVKFSGKTNELQPQNVYIAINGVPLVAQRNTPVVIPESYLEVARHSNIQTFDIDAEGNRIPITIANYPFDTICEATEEDYKMLLGRKRPLSEKEVEEIKNRAKQ